MNRVALNILKIALPAALFAFLLWRVPASDYEAFWSRPKRWEFLALAQVLALSAITIGIVRWWGLVRAFGIPFEIHEALRLGFLGYLLNFVSLGSVVATYSKPSWWPSTNRRRDLRQWLQSFWIEPLGCWVW